MDIVRLTNILPEAVFYIKKTIQDGWKRVVLQRYLKAVRFEPEFAGKLNFYVNAVNDILCGEHDNPTIGILTLIVVIVFAASSTLSTLMPIFLIAISRSNSLYTLYEMKQMHTCASILLSVK